MAAKNIFATAKTVEAPTPKVGKKETAEVAIKDLDTLSAINAALEMLKTLKTTYEVGIKDEMLTYFIDQTLIQQERPDNFKGTGSISEASCQMRKRASSSPLSELEQELLKQHSVSLKTEVIMPAQDEKYFFSPEVMELIANKPKVATKISSVLSNIPELKGVDILVHEAATEEISNAIVDDNTFADAAKITDRDALKEVYKTISTLSIGPKLHTDDIKVILEFLSKAGLDIKIEENKKNKKK